MELSSYMIATEGLGPGGSPSLIATLGFLGIVEVQVVRRKHGQETWFANIDKRYDIIIRVKLGDKTIERKYQLSKFVGNVLANLVEISDGDITVKSKLVRSEVNDITVRGIKK